MIYSVNLIVAFAIQTSLCLVPTAFWHVPLPSFFRYSWYFSAHFVFSLTLTWIKHSFTETGFIEKQYLENHSFGYAYDDQGGEED